MEEYLEPGDPGEMGPGAGGGAAILLLVLISFGALVFSGSVLVGLAVFAALLVVGLLLNAAYDQYVL